MKAAVCTAYGPPNVLQVTNRPKPVPKASEICVKMHATSVTASDTIVRGFKLKRNTLMGFMMALVLGFRRPRKPILGMIVSGEVESIGERVSRYKIGDRVFGWTLSEGPPLRFGAYAEYICLPEKSLLAQIPANKTFTESSAIPYGGSLAWYFLKKYDIAKRKRMLIYGASGAIGTAAIQISKYFGAQVDVVCSNHNANLVKELGADRIYDYHKETFPDKNKKYNLIFDAVGKSKTSDFKINMKNSLAENGKIFSVDDGSPKTTRETMSFLAELYGKNILKPIIDRIYTLDQIIEAHRYVDAGHKKGNVIIKITE